MGESVYLNDNASVEAILYEKKNGYFSFFLFFFFHHFPRIGILYLENKKEGKISIFLFVENSFYERIIVEINALPHAK